jgi:hypothetical protein
MKLRQVIVSLLVVTAFPLLAHAQSLSDPKESSGTTAGTTPRPLGLMYLRPTTREKLHSYLFDTFGPYPVVGAGLAAAVNQADNTPPEWKQGAAGYGKRFVSDFGINAVTMTTRYALAELFREDTLYYRCGCKGVFPRLGHAMISTFISRRGDDGHRVFSFPALVAPYAGTMTAVYGWYPDRYNAQDGFRMGNYNLLVDVAENVVLEFIYSGPRSLVMRMHLNNGHGAKDPSPAP